MHPCLLKTRLTLGALYAATDNEVASKLLNNRRQKDDDSDMMTRYRSVRYLMKAALTGNELDSSL